MGVSTPWEEAIASGTSAHSRGPEGPNYASPVEPRRPLRQASAMDPLPPPLAFFVLLFSGWVNRHQQVVIDYLLEENRVLRATRDPRRRRLTDDQRRRLAVKGKVLGRRRLAAVAGIVTPSASCDYNHWHRYIGGWPSIGGNSGPDRVPAWDLSRVPTDGESFV